MGKKIHLLLMAGVVSSAICFKTILPTTEDPKTTLESAPSFKFVPIIEWLNALGFIKKEEVLFLANNMLTQQREVLLQEINMLKTKIDNMETGNGHECHGLQLSNMDQAKLKFLLQQVVTYK